MGLLAVTLGQNQHVSGLGITLAADRACEFTFRVGYGTGTPASASRSSRAASTVLDVLDQHWMTYVGFRGPGPGLLVGPALDRRRVSPPRRRREPEAADVAASRWPRPATSRWSSGRADGGRWRVPDASVLLGTYTLDIVNGRGWVCIALVIFGTWRAWPTVAGAALRRRRRAAAAARDHRPLRARATRADDRAALPRGHRRARGVGPVVRYPSAYLRPTAVGE